MPENKADNAMPEDKAQVRKTKPREPRLRLTREKVVIPEKVREKNGLYVLELLGYKTWRLGKPVPVTCKNPNCRTFQWAQTTGNTTGVSDTLIGHKIRWPGVVLMIETKKTGGPKREEQIALVEEGFSTFVTTEEDFVRAVMAAEERMGLAVNPRLVNWLEVNHKGL